jgi:hypothetical protein
VTTAVPLAFLDCETDGVHPGRKAWEIAIVRREPDGTETEWQAFVDIDLSTADLFGLRVGQFYDRHPLGRDLSGGVRVTAERGPNWIGTARAANEVARLTHGAYIFGANPSFDTETLAPLLRGHGLVPAWHYTPWCTTTLAVGFLAAKGQLPPSPWKSYELSRLVGVEPPSETEEHTAMGDVRWVMRMWDAIQTPDPRNYLPEEPR